MTETDGVTVGKQDGARWQCDDDGFHRPAPTEKFPYHQQWLDEDYLNALEQQRDDLLERVTVLETRLVEEAQRVMINGRARILALAERDDLLAALAGAEAHVALATMYLRDGRQGSANRELSEWLVTARALIARIKHPEGG